MKNSWETELHVWWTWKRRSFRFHASKKAPELPAGSLDPPISSWEHQGRQCQASGNLGEKAMEITNREREVVRAWMELQLTSEEKVSEAPSQWWKQSKGQLLGRSTTSIGNKDDFCDGKDPGAEPGLVCWHTAAQPWLVPSYLSRGVTHTADAKECYEE